MVVRAMNAASCRKRRAPLWAKVSCSVDLGKASLLLTHDHDDCDTRTALKVGSVSHSLTAISACDMNIFTHFDTLLPRHWCSSKPATIHYLCSYAPPYFGRPSAVSSAAPMWEAMRNRIQNGLGMPNGDPEGRRSPGPVLEGRAARTDQLSLPEMLAFSIPVFCRRHGISRAHFYNLSKSGDAPAVMRVRRRTLVSAEAAAEWRRRMEEASRLQSVE